MISSPRASPLLAVTATKRAGARSFSLEVQTPREGRAAVRRIVPDHPDVIKVFTDGWRYDTAPDMTSMDEATLTAIVDEAHKNNLKVLTHTVTLARAKIAARAGVDILAHGTGDAPVDAELIFLDAGARHVLRFYSGRFRAAPEPACRAAETMGQLAGQHQGSARCGRDAGMWHGRR